MVRNFWLHVSATGLCEARGPLHYPLTVLAWHRVCSMINNERVQFSTASFRRNTTLYYCNSVTFDIHWAKAQVTKPKSVQSVKNKPVPGSLPLFSLLFHPDPKMNLFLILRNGIILFFLSLEGCKIITKFWWHNINSKWKEIHCKFCNLPAWEQSFCSKHCKHPFKDVVNHRMTHSFLHNILILHQNPVCTAYERKECPNSAYYRIFVAYKLQACSN